VMVLVGTLVTVVAPSTAKFSEAKPVKESAWAVGAKKGKARTRTSVEKPPYFILPPYLELRGHRRLIPPGLIRIRISAPGLRGGEM
jgi:hypothetical protein